TFGGVILDESPDGCWTVHQSIVEYHGQWYLFYHDKDLSPEVDKNRSIRAEYLTFNADGTIQKVKRTLRGVGCVDATRKVEIDGYSDASTNGVVGSFLNATKRQEGWKVSLEGKKTWVKYDRVDFGAGKLKSMNVRSESVKGGTVEIRADKVDGPVLAKVKVAK